MYLALEQISQFPEESGTTKTMLCIGKKFPHLNYTQKTSKKTRRGRSFKKKMNRKETIQVLFRGEKK